MAGCGDVTPATWDDVAAGIPGNSEAYVVVPDSLIGTEAYKTFVNKDGEFAALDEALGLCSTHPEYIVGFEYKSDFIATWPASDPNELAEATKNWKEATLHGDIDGRIKVVDRHSIVVSETQVWIVNSRDGVTVVNGALKAADKQSASSLPLLHNLIVNKNVTLQALCRIGDNKDKIKYISVSPTLKGGILTVDVDLKNTEGSTEPFIETTTQLNLAQLQQKVAGRAFAAFETPKGFISKVIKTIADIADDTSMRIVTSAVAPLFDKCSGTFIATLDDDNLEIRLPFATAEDATKAHTEFVAMLSRIGVKVDMAIEGASIVYRQRIDDQSFDYAISQPETLPEFSDEQLVGIAGGHITGPDIEADILTTLTTDHIRIRIETSPVESLQKFINNLPK